MERILWIAPRHAPTDLKAMLSAQGAELVSFDSVDLALKSTQGLAVSVAVIAADVKEFLAGIPRFTRARPEVQVMAATEAGVTRQTAYALRSGALGVLDLRGQFATVAAHQVKEAIERYHQGERERELLLKLRGLNEEFLKNVIAAERRNIELEEELNPLSESLAIETDPARILIVDDESTVSDVIELILRKQGHHYLTVATAEAALEAMAHQSFHVVLTDKNLPGQTGLELMREVKTRSPDTDVILMTGYANTESAIEALNLGAAGYLEKPFEHVNKVREKIDAVLAAQRDRLRKRHLLGLIKQRNRRFLEQYRAIRADLEAWLQSRGVSTVSDVTEPKGNGST